MTTTLAEQATRFTRQEGIFPPADYPNASVTFVGCGGIGSFAAHAAAKLGIPNIRLIDFDSVDSHNIPNQQFTEQDMGHLKVDALGCDLLTINPNLSLRLDAVPFQDAPPLTGIVVSGLDSMKARQDLWDRIKLDPSVTYYIDGRLDKLYSVLYGINPCDMTDIEQYEKTLKSDDEVESAMCTERGIIYVGYMIGALITRLASRRIMGQDTETITVVNYDTMALTTGTWVVI